MRCGAVVTIAATLASAPVAAQPLSEAAPRAFMVGCGTAVVGGMPLLAEEGAPLRDAGLSVVSDVPVWVSSNVNPSAGEATIFQVAADSGEAYIISYAKTPLCQLLSRGEASLVSDGLASTLSAKPWKSVADVTTGPTRRREFEMKTSGRLLAATMMSPAAAAPADADLVMIFLGRKQ